MTAQFIPPAKPILGDDERKAVDEVIASGMVAQGPQVHAFEDEFSSQVVDGVHCVAVNSGTSALHIGLLASGIGEGDEVIVPSFTFAATGNSVALSGAKPVFADVESATGSGCWSIGKRGEFCMLATGLRCSLDAKLCSLSVKPPKPRASFDNVTSF